MKSAWVENGRIRDVCHGEPNGCYVSEIAAHYTALVPDEAENGDGWDGVNLTKAAMEPEVQSDPVASPPPTTIGVIEFKMLFSSAERIATSASTDPVIVDLQQLLNDPRTKTVNRSLKSISEALDYMTFIGILAEGRKAEILTGAVK